MPEANCATKDDEGLWYALGVAYGLSHEISAFVYDTVFLPLFTHIS